MFLNDALEDRRIARPVPRAFGIHDGDGAALADAKAIHLAAQDAALLRQSELLQAALEKLPRRETAILITAFRVRLVAAQKDVAASGRDADRFGHALLRFAGRRQTPNSSASHSMPSSLGGAM